MHHLVLINGNIPGSCEIIRLWVVHGFEEDPQDGTLSELAVATSS